MDWGGSRQAQGRQPSFPPAALCPLGARRMFSIGSGPQKPNQMAEALREAIKKNYLQMS